MFNRKANKLSQKGALFVEVALVLAFVLVACSFTDLGPSLRNYLGNYGTKGNDNTGMVSEINDIKVVALDKGSVNGNKGDTPGSKPPSETPVDPTPKNPDVIWESKDGDTVRYKNNDFWDSKLKTIYKNSSENLPNQTSIFGTKAIEVGAAETIVVQVDSMNQTVKTNQGTYKLSDYMYVFVITDEAGNLVDMQTGRVGAGTDGVWTSKILNSGTDTSKKYYLHLGFYYSNEETGKSDKGHHHENILSTLLDGHTSVKRVTSTGETTNSQATTANGGR